MFRCGFCAAFSRSSWSAGGRSASPSGSSGAGGRSSSRGIHASAICGSDLHKYRQSVVDREAGGYDKLVLGHEGSGVVDAVGPGVVHPKIGDRVVAYHLIGCGACEHCRAGEPGFCQDLQGFNWVRDGVDAEYVVVPARYALPLPDDFDFEDGALLACNVGTAYGAARKAEASGDMTLAVSGLGPVGLYTVMMARAMGAPVIGVDVQQDRISLAERLGIEATVNAADSDPVVAVRAFSGGGGVGEQQSEKEGFRFHYQKSR